MTRVIDAPGVAKVTSADDALRELTNELARVRRRLRKAELKLEGLHALEEDLQSRLPAEEYEYTQVKLQLRFLTGRPRLARKGCRLPGD